MNITLAVASLLAIGVAAHSALALSEGPNAPAIVVNDPSVGTIAWTNPAAAAVSDDVGALAVLGAVPDAMTNYLKASDLGFSIPAGAVITGIEVFVERTTLGISDAGFFLVKNGVVVGDDRSVPGLTDIVPEMVSAYGGSSDLWGETWTAADVNDPDFGFVMAQSHLIFGFAVVDSISIAVSYLPCGDGQLDAGEQCDDGNTAAGDCCSPTCQFDPAATACADATLCNGDETCDGAGACLAGVEPVCDDGDPCSQDGCQPAVGCVNDYVPAGGCRSALKSALILKDKQPDTGDSLVWKWIRGEATSPAELGTPTGTTQYALCLYAGTASASYVVPGDAAKWSTIGSGGYKYKDAAGAASGITKITLKANGQPNKSKALVKGKGVNLTEVALDALDDGGSVTVQLINDATAACFASTFSAADFVIADDPGRFKAKQP